MPENRFWDDVDDLPASLPIEGTDTLLIRRPGAENGGRGSVWQISLQRLVDAIVSAAGAARR